MICCNPFNHPIILVTRLDLHSNNDLLGNHLRNIRKSLRKKTTTNHHPQIRLSNPIDTLRKVTCPNLSCFLCIKKCAEVTKCKRIYALSGNRAPFTSVFMRCFRSAFTLTCFLRYCADPGMLILEPSRSSAGVDAVCCLWFYEGLRKVYGWILSEMFTLIPLLTGKCRFCCLPLPFPRLTTLSWNTWLSSAF